VPTNSASPGKRHVHERTPSGNTNWETVATTRAYTTPAAQKQQCFLCMAIYLLLGNYPSRITRKSKEVFKNFSLKSLTAYKN
jgi:hypothetical protein